MNGPYRQGIKDFSFKHMGISKITIARLSSTKVYDKPLK